jgi:hypothetical protein
VPLEGIAESPDALIVKSFIAILRADSFLTTNFDPILLVEAPTVEAFKEIAAYSLAVVPGRVTLVDHASERSTIRIEIITAFYLPIEPSNEDSLLRGLDLFNHVRKLSWENAELPKVSNPAIKITFGTVDVERLTPLETKEGVRVLAFKTVYQTDINPVTGVFM